MRHKIRTRPRLFKAGEAIAFSGRSIDWNSEDFVVVRFSLDRWLHGRVLEILLRDYFEDMSPDSGVFITPFVQRRELVDDDGKPGDVDLIFIPYEGNELLLSRTLAIECKLIRASYERKAKSPNSLGGSQADGLKRLGFPHIGLVHFIIAERAPQHTWREVEVGRVVDDSGRVERVGKMQADMMPAELMDRAHGRLKSVCNGRAIGCASVFYCFFDEIPNRVRGEVQRNVPVGTWLPEGDPCPFNADFDPKLLSKLAALFDNSPNRFFDSLRY
ncbi:MAG: hypothetical protein AB7O04_15715 [Hyphomonadaceae bacterium]